MPEASARVPHPISRASQTDSREIQSRRLARCSLEGRIPSIHYIAELYIPSLKGVRNDAGIVYAKQPYVIALYSKNLADERSAENTLVDISAAVWEAFGGE